MDWLLGSLTPFGGYHLDQGFEIGEELLTTLAFRQLALGHEGGNWANVERRRAQFPPLAGEVLAIDAVQPLEENLATVLEYVTG